MIRRPTRATLFAYTTLFRSHPARDPCCCRPPPQRPADSPPGPPNRSEEHTSELQSHSELVCRLLREKKKAISRGSSCASNRARATSLKCDRKPVGTVDSCAYVFNDTATTGIYTLSLHDALPI